LRRVDERKNREAQVLLSRPMDRFSVLIYRSNHDEKQRRAATNQEQQTSSYRYVFLIKRAQSVSGSHHSDPRNQRVENKHDRTRKAWTNRKQSRLMKQHPELGSPAGRRILGKSDDSISIEIIVAGDHKQAKRRNNF